jgi:predicted nucleic acid-binding protein
LAVVLDTSFIWAVFEPRDPRHARSAAALRDLVRGSWGSLLTNDYVYAEALALAIQGGPGAVRRMDEFFLGDESLVQLVRVDQRAFAAARERLLAQPERGLGLVDWTLVILAERHRARAIATLDRALGRTFGMALP